MVGDIITSENCLTKTLQDKFTHLQELIGNTPMICIHYQYKGKHRRVYIKCEQYNLTGSIKDRMALYILQNAYKQCAIKPGDTIIEASSGNTGISFAAIGKALGHPVKIIMPDWLSRERFDIIRSMGASIITISREAGGFIGSIKLAEFLAEQNKNVFLPRQFENSFNVQAHKHTTGPEIAKQLLGNGIVPDAFIAGVGTGGTVMGVGAYLGLFYPSITIHPLEPASSPTLSTGYKSGSHRIQGISDEFIPDILNLEELSSIVKVEDGDAIIMAQLLASKLGLAVGISSGANMAGAIKLQEHLGVDATVVTVFADCNKKYLSTDLVKTEPVHEEYISSHVELLHYTSIGRSKGGM